MNNMYSEESPSLSEGEEAASVALPKRRSFKEAFAEARKVGEKQFTWQGKRYSTELAGAAAPTRAAKRSYTGAEAASDFEREVRPGRRGPGMYGGTYQPGKSAEAQAMRKRGELAGYTGDEAASDFIREAKRGVARRGPAMYGSTFKPERSAEAEAMRGYKKGGMVSASSRGDGIAKKGKTRGRMV